MEEVLKSYIEFIDIFEKKMILQYQLEQNSWLKAGILFSKKGVIDGYNYSFHGSGCTLEKDGIICEYDIAPLDVKGIKFSLWKFSKFIETHPKYKELNYDKEYVEKELLNLINIGLLSWLRIDGHVFKIYCSNL